jgi:hypothetical protein
MLHKDVHKQGGQFDDGISKRSIKPYSGENVNNFPS